MNHASIIALEGARLYGLRGYIISQMDEAYVDFACEDDMLQGLNGYCLDALGVIPAGSMEPIFRLPAQTLAVRGMTAAELAERDAMAEQLIAEILAEDEEDADLTWAEAGGYSAGLSRPGRCTTTSAAPDDGSNDIEF